MENKQYPLFTEDESRETMTGIVFDIKQMAVFDGPGIRTTVFFKGCPLRCEWCHNPEGLSFAPQLMVSGNGCLHCGQCVEVCEYPGDCRTCGACVRVCPLHLRKICGIRYTADALAEKLLKNKAILEMNGGGVTFSGGEPTGQAAFLIEVLQRLEGLHRAMETCGYCEPSVFSGILKHLDYVLMDIKIVDSELHRQWTGRDNTWILQNLELLKKSGLPFVIRIPLIPGVNDNINHFKATAGLIQDAPGLERVELLPYHKTAGAKYSMVNRNYQVHFDPDAEVFKDTSVFADYGITAIVL